MDVKVLIERLSKDIAHKNLCESDKEAISWPYEEGILVSIAEAEFILDLLKAFQDGKH